MSAVNQETNLTRQVPTVSGVTKWIKQAKGLPRMLEFRSGSSRRLRQDPGMRLGIAPWQLFSRAAKLEGLSKNIHKAD
jgi:hypothetical protein